MVNKIKAQSEMAAVVNGRNLPISFKTSVILCKVVKNRKIEPSIKFLEAVEREKIGISFAKGKVRKGNNGMKYPHKAAGVFVKLLKSLSANAVVNGVDPSKILVHARADKAARPNKPGARPFKFKRAHVTLEGTLVADKVTPVAKSEEKKKND